MWLRRAARRLAERILSVLFWVLLMLSFNSPLLTAMTLLAALVHECAHAAVLYRYRGRGRFLSTPRGIVLHRNEKTLSYREELMLTLAGPLSNLCAVLLSLLLLPFGEDFFSLFAAINLLTAVSNLIPVKSYDGHKILFLLLATHLGEGLAYRVCRILSLTFTSALTLLSLYLIGRIGGGYWIFGVFFASLIVQLFDHAFSRQKKSI